MVNLLVPAFDIYIWRLFGVFLHLLRPTAMQDPAPPEDECGDCSIKRGNFNVTTTLSVSRSV